MNGNNFLFTENHGKLRFFKGTDATWDQYVCEFAGSENVAVGKKIIKTTPAYSDGEADLLLITNNLLL